MKKLLQKNNRVVIYVAISSCFVCLFAQEKKQPLRLIHADQLSRETMGKKIQQKLTGHVEFQQGETTIKCDIATQFVGEDPIALIGRVQIFDPSRSLSADTVYFYEKERKQAAVGNVVSITESDTTIANRITYYQNGNKVISERNVRIANRDERSIVTGQFAEYLRNERYGKIVGEPVLVKLDSLEQEFMRVTGDTMELREGGEQTHVSGSVKITQAETVATSQVAQYFKNEDRTLLTGNPKVLQRNRQITGDTLSLFLDNNQLSRALVKGNATATSDADTLNKGRWVNKLTGQKMDFYFKNKKLQRVVIDEQATSIHHVIEEKQYKGANEVSGDKIEVYFTDGDLERVVVTSKPEFSSGKYSPPRI